MKAETQSYLTGRAAHHALDAGWDMIFWDGRAMARAGPASHPPASQIYLGRAALDQFTPMKMTYKGSQAKVVLVATKKVENNAVVQKAWSRAVNQTFCSEHIPGQKFSL